jgi:energy-converting hydrogenase Eha subunit A
MSAHESVQRDERTVAVENASYRWAYTFVAFALLIDVMFRAWFRHEAAWDLMALAVVPGIACGVYQARRKILGEVWGLKLVLIACVAGVISGVVAVILTITRAM